MRTLALLLLLLLAGGAHAAAPPRLDWSADHGDGRAGVNASVSEAGPAATSVDLRLAYVLNETASPETVVGGRAEWRLATGTLALELGIPRWIACLVECAPDAETAREARFGASGAVGDAEEPERVARDERARTQATMALAGSASTLAPLAWTVARAGLVSLYSRLGRTKVLGDPRRQAILALLAAERALTAAEMSRRLAIPRTSMLHHLAILSGHGLVASRREGRRTLYVARGQRVAVEEVEARALLAVPTRAAVLEALRGAARTQQELAALTGLPRRTVAHHLGRLAERGLVAVVEERRPARYAAVEPASAGN